MRRPPPRHLAADAPAPAAVGLECQVLAGLGRASAQWRAGASGSWDGTGAAARPGGWVRADT